MSLGRAVSLGLHLVDESGHFCAVKWYAICSNEPTAKA